MGQVIHGPWVTPPARVSAELDALPEPDSCRRLIMPQVLSHRHGDEQYER
jgi:hypothetical protein